MNEGRRPVLHRVRHRAPSATLDATLSRLDRATPHIAGALGAALTTRCFDLGWMERTERGHAVTVTPAGRRGFRKTFGIDASDR